eukprot:758412-Hanusia_phi.AAC.6
MHSWQKTVEQRTAALGFNQIPAPSRSDIGTRTKTRTKEEEEEEEEEEEGGGRRDEEELRFVPLTRLQRHRLASSQHDFSLGVKREREGGGGRGEQVWRENKRGEDRKDCGARGSPRQLSWASSSAQSDRV